MIHPLYPEMKPPTWNSKKQISRFFNHVIIERRLTHAIQVWPARVRTWLIYYRDHLLSEWERPIGRRSATEDRQRFPIVQPKNSKRTF